MNSLQTQNGFIEIGIEKDDVMSVAIEHLGITSLSETQIDVIYDIFQQAEIENPDVRWDILMAQCIKYVLNN
jgi:hypothetical protein